MKIISIISVCLTYCNPGWSAAVGPGLSQHLTDMSHLPYASKTLYTRKQHSRPDDSHSHKGSTLSIYVTGPQSDE